MGDYLNPKGLDGAMPDIGSSTHIEVAMHGDETEDVKILRTPEAPMENVSFPIARVEMPASEVPSPVEIDVAEHITAGAILTETIQGEAIGFEVTITTSISVGND